MVELRERTEQHVTIYYEKTQDEIVRKLLPSSAKTVEDALRMFRETQHPNAKSIGKTIYYNREYVGDIWCYGLWEEPNAMLSYCIFEKTLWGKGIASKAVELFITFLQENLGIKSIGAFTYEDNVASVHVLETNKFSFVERFEDNGVTSIYYERNLC